MAAEARRRGVAALPGTRLVGTPTPPPVGSNGIQPYVGKKTSTQACFCWLVTCWTSVCGSSAPGR